MVFGAYLVSLQHSTGLDAECSTLRELNLGRHCLKLCQDGLSGAIQLVGVAAVVATEGDGLEGLGGGKGGGQNLEDSSS
jgi:hypothetical protein